MDSIFNFGNYPIMAILAIFGDLGNFGASRVIRRAPPRSPKPGAPGIRLTRGSTLLYLYSMLAIRLPQSIEKRLERLARRTGRTKSYYVREAILEHLEDLEDLYLAEARLERIRSGQERKVSLKDVMKRHGL
jgi:RHH-type rel operon transcriptional repressor/antitoxin RelB